VINLLQSYTNTATKRLRKVLATDCLLPA